jgi:hypothetical protein
MIFTIGWLWLIGALILMWAAYSKGRAAFGWFLIGLVLGPLSLIMAVLVGVLPTPPDYSVIKKCPDCAELVKIEALKCRFCGCRFIDNQVEESP